MKNLMYGHSRIPIFFAVTILAISLLAAPGLAQAQQDAPPNTINDAMINEEIELEIAIDQRVDAENIEVRTHDGVVVVDGWVEDIRSRERAVSIASSIRGVKAVVCDCEVRPVERSDMAIATDVKHAFALDPVADSYEIDIEVEDGIVELEGNVESFAEKQLSANVAKTVRGVKGIENELEIDYDANRKDAEIEQEVERRLLNNNLVNTRFIDVEVENNRVILSGAIGSAKHRDQAYAESWVAGVKDVDTSQVDVKWWIYDDITRTKEQVNMDDQETEEAIEDALMYEPRVNEFRITVDVEDGIAKLTGRVDNLKAKNAAERDALNTMGVWRVDNNIEVHSGDLPANSTVEDKVRTALMWNPITEKYEIEAEVNNHEVYLDGSVDTHYEKMMAADIASNVFGVINVVNNIEVEESEPMMSDSELKKSVEKQYTWSFEVDAPDIDITVNNGIVTLDGDVGTIREYNAAVENAFEGGAVAVKTHIRIHGTNDFEESVYYYDDFYKRTY
jgi:osmotically-inducible protein OsmY